MTAASYAFLLSHNIVKSPRKHADLSSGFCQRHLHNKADSCQVLKFPKSKCSCQEGGYHFGGYSNNNNSSSSKSNKNINGAIKSYSHSFRFTSDKSAVSLLESGEQRHIKAINNNKTQETQPTDEHFWYDSDT